MLSAIVLAAGVGNRLNSKISKPLVRINNIAIIIYSLKVLNKNKNISEIIIVVNPNNQKQIKQALKKHSLKKIKSFVLGGVRRQDSVFNGLKDVSVNTDLVLIHDAARPFLTGQLVDRVILAAKNFGAAILGVVPKATIKCVKRDNFVALTLARSKLWEVQTPQVFKKELLLRAYKKYAGLEVTDDASLIEKMGAPIKIVAGSYENIKITTAEDLLWAKLIAKRNKYAI